MDRIDSTTCIIKEGILGPIKRVLGYGKKKGRTWFGTYDARARERKEREGRFSRSEPTEADRGVHTVFGFVVKSRSQGEYSYYLITMFSIVFARSSPMSG